MNTPAQAPVADSSASSLGVFTPLWRLLDLPHLAFAVLFFWLLFGTQLNDPDYFWHLKAGEYIFANRGLPSGDPFSYTFHGQPWALHEWLFEVALYGVFALLGPGGVKLLTAVLGMLSLYIVFRAAALNRFN